MIGGDVAVDLDKRRLEGDCEEEGAQRVALLDSCLHPSNEAVEAVEEPRVRAVRDDEPPYEVRRILV